MQLVQGEGQQQQEQQQQQHEVHTGGVHGAEGGGGADHHFSSMAHGLAAHPAPAANTSSNVVQGLAEGGIESAASSVVMVNAWSRPLNLNMGVAVEHGQSSGDGLVAVGPHGDAVEEDVSLGWEPDTDQKESVKPVRRMRRHGKGYVRGRRPGRDSKEQGGAKIRRDGGGGGAKVGA